MLSVLTSFAALAIVVMVGYIVRRTNLVNAEGERNLSQLIFFVSAPVLLAETLQDADLAHAFSRPLLIVVISAFVASMIFLLIAKFAWKRETKELVMGVMATAYTNSTYLGIPISVYVLGSAEYAAPLILFQMCFFNPLLTTILMASDKSGEASVVTRVAKGMVTNPVLIGAVAGILLNVTNVQLPNVIAQPVELLGQIAVPSALLIFGMSFYGVSPLQDPRKRKDALLASSGSLVIMPVIAYLVGGPVLGLTGHDLFAAVIIAALPTGQNAYMTAVVFNTGKTVSRDAILITSIGSVFVMMLIAAFLA